jgi:hypothetical protein
VTKVVRVNEEGKVGFAVLVIVPVLAVIVFAHSRYRCAGGPRRPGEPPAGKQPATAAAALKKKEPEPGTKPRQRQSGGCAGNSEVTGILLRCL